MVLQRTLTVQIGKVCAGKLREQIVTEVTQAFSIHPVVAVQVGFDIVRVTFRDTDSFKLARAGSHVCLFGSNCVIQGGGPPPTMIHIFDYPAKLGDEVVRRVLSGYGDVKSVRRQKYIGRPDIETGTRLVLLTLKATPPVRFLSATISAGFGTRGNRWCATCVVLMGTSQLTVLTRTSAGVVGSRVISSVPAQTLGVLYRGWNPPPPRIFLILDLQSPPPLRPLELSRVTTRGFQV